MLRIEFDTDNAAFRDGDVLHTETARIVAQVAATLAEAREFSGTCRDINGNTVGSWELS